MKKGLIALGLAAAFTFTACYGSYGLTTKLYKWNGTLGNKWLNSCVHFLMWIIPVYPICAGLIDGLVLNTVEFWSGSNPVASGDTYYEKDAQGNQVAAVKNADGSLSMEITDAQGNKANLKLERDADVIRALDANGEVVAQYDVK
ncbi:MAG: DUF3332 family protein [Hallerella porci]|uniref:Uncharacterized protein DUF3332 n=1 Tax=Hallerella porci TaxID=1945871 RepID=A0ABX5LLC3_9BACT|nr:MULTISPECIES: DUF3332 family protein [Hallerella]MCI5601262.1 DUF3332 domain-containing protein [Hallerella sp.]MDY3922699.1 DUF3332 family protein [Hallerella porci]PWL01941.1 uncharacterized protein DUF3332 [Hallerella porci]